MNHETVSILILDDDKSISAALKHFLSTYLHHQVTAFGHPAEAMAAIKNSAPDILICDLNLPETDGISFIKLVKELPGTQPEIIIITGYGEKWNAIQCLRLGAIDFLEKPFPLDMLKASVDRAVKFISIRGKATGKKHSGKPSATASNNQFPEVVGISKSIENIRLLIERIARTNDTSVLITGETGTGKEIIARQIHRMSHRKSHPFFAKNCATVPEQLFESEFFGHVKGAFTNAISDHKGWFETAQDSTLLLDEINELPLSMQPKLLRVLEEKNLNKVGSSNVIPLNVRVIAASNNDLQGLCVENKFRMDLFYRLNIFSIHVPPLRDRKEDIPALFELFINQAVLEHQRNPVSIQQQAIDLLLGYSFPGNVRELKNMAEQIIILNDESRITNRMISNVMDRHNLAGKPVETTDNSMARLEANLIIDALKKSDNVIARAARILQITDQSLLRRIKKFGITLPV